MEERQCERNPCLDFGNRMRHSLQEVVAGQCYLVEYLLISPSLCHQKSLGTNVWVEGCKKRPCWELEMGPYNPYIQPVMGGYVFRL